MFRNSLFQLFPFYTDTESFDVSIEPKKTEDPPKQFKREYIWVFFRKFRVVSVCFGLLRNSSVCFGGCFDIGSKHRNKPKQMRNRFCFGLFRFEPKFIFVCSRTPYSGVYLFLKKSSVAFHEKRACKKKDMRKE